MFDLYNKRVNPLMSVMCLSSMNQCVLCESLPGGFYSQLARPGLRVVSLNTVLYYGPDKATANDTDPAGQFLWLQRTLERAAQNLEKVEAFG